MPHKRYGRENLVRKKLTSRHPTSTTSFQDLQLPFGLGRHVMTAEPTRANTAPGLRGSWVWPSTHSRPQSRLALLTVGDWARAEAAIMICRACAERPELLNSRTSGFCVPRALRPSILVPRAAWPSSPGPIGSGDENAIHWESLIRLFCIFIPRLIQWHCAISEEIFSQNSYRFVCRRHADAHPASVYKMEQYGRIAIQMILGSHSTFPNPFHSTRPEFKSSATLVKSR